MIFAQYTETCEVLLYYTKTGEDDVIGDYAKKSIRNLLHANIDVHSIRLIDEFPKDGINVLKNYNHIVQKWLLLIEVDMTGPFNKSHIKEGNLQSTTSIGFKMHMLYQFQ